MLLSSSSISEVSFELVTDHFPPLVKAINQLVFILHFEGTMMTSNLPIKIAQFFNDLTIVFFYLACSLNFYKW